MTTLRQSAVQRMAGYRPSYSDLCPKTQNVSTFTPFSCYTQLSKARRILAMKTKHTFVIFALLAFTSIPTHSQTVVGFDDLSETASGSWLQNGYQGLNWNMVLVNNAILGTNSVWRGPTGDYFGMVSPSNAAVLFGNPSITGNSEIDSPGTNFNFLSAYFTGPLTAI